MYQQLNNCFILLLFTFGRTLSTAAPSNDDIHCPTSGIVFDLVVNDVHIPITKDIHSEQISAHDAVEFQFRIPLDIRIVEMTFTEQVSGSEPRRVSYCMGGNKCGAADFDLKPLSDSRHVTITMSGSILHESCTVHKEVILHNEKCPSSTNISCMKIIDGKTNISSILDKQYQKVFVYNNVTVKCQTSPQTPFRVIDFTQLIPGGEDKTLSQCEGGHICDGGHVDMQPLCERDSDRMVVSVTGRILYEYCDFSKTITFIDERSGPDDYVRSAGFDLKRMDEWCGKITMAAVSPEAAEWLQYATILPDLRETFVRRAGEGLPTSVSAGASNLSNVTSETQMDIRRALGDIVFNESMSFIDGHLPVPRAKLRIVLLSVALGLFTIVILATVVLIFTRRRRMRRGPKTTSDGELGKGKEDNTQVTSIIMDLPSPIGTESAIDTSDKQMSLSDDSQDATTTPLVTADESGLEKNEDRASYRTTSFEKPSRKLASSPGRVDDGYATLPTTECVLTPMFGSDP